MNELLVKITQEYDSRQRRWITVKHYICWYFVFHKSQRLIAALE